MATTESPTNNTASTKSVASGKTIDYKVSLDEGPAEIVNTAVPVKGASLDRVIYVHAPGAKTTPYLVRATSARVEVISFDVPNGMQGDWVVKVTPFAAKTTNGNGMGALGETSKLEVGVAFESGEKRELKFPIQVANRVVTDLVAAFEPQLVLDTRDCHIAYKDDGHPKKQPLLKPEQLRFKKGPWQVELSDIKTKEISVSIEEANARYPGGFVRARVVFEEEGTEVKISWAPDAEVSGLVLTATVGLAVENGSLTYEDVAVAFPIRINFNVVPDVLVDALIGYSKRIRTMLEAKLMEVAESSRATLQKHIDGAIAKFVPNARITGVTVTGGALVVTYTEK